MPKIDPRAQVLSLSDFARASNPSHRHFHHTILMRVTEEFAQRYGLGGLREEYAAQVEREAAATERFKGRNMSQTEDIARLHAELTRQYKSLIRLLKVHAGMPMPEMAAAAKRLLHKVDTRVDKLRLGYTEISANMYKLLYHLRQPEVADAVATLHLGPVLDRVAELDEEFREQERARTMEFAALRRLGITRQLRPVVDQAATNFFKGMQVIHMQNELIGKDPDVAREVGDMIEFVNAQIYDMKRNIRRNKRRRKKTPEGEAEDKAEDKKD